MVLYFKIIYFSPYTFKYNIAWWVEMLIHVYKKKKFDMQTEFVSYKLHVIKVASLSWILFDASAFFIF